MSLDNNTRGVAKNALKHLLSPAQNMESLGRSALPILTKGEGIYVFDQEGRKFIDGPAGMWCTQIGYGRREISEAIAAQAQQFSYGSPWYTTNNPAVTLAARIAEMTPGDLNRIFFTTGGSTAVDTALRFSEFYNNVLGRPKKKRILVRHDGYHGSTSLTAACSGREGNWPNFDIRQDRISFLSSPNMRLANGLSETEFLEKLIAEVEDRIAALGAETIAVFLAEPLLASGGVIIPPVGYHARVKALCEAHDILYVSDEVVTGFGRCGEWFASEAVFGVVPDIITFAKGLTSGYLPLGGLAISDAVIARVSQSNAQSSVFTNGYTYSGHPVSCAAAVANIEVMERDGILDHVRDVSQHFANAINALADLPGVVSTRSKGLVGCVECMTDPARTVPGAEDMALGARVDAICLEHGLIVRPIGNMCVLSPPLIISRDEIDDMMAILRKGIQMAGAELGLS